MSNQELFDPLTRFECYRALVRSEVHALGLGKWNEDASRYFRYAVQFTWRPFQPFDGKST
jgi:hypothetical protein